MRLLNINNTRFFAKFFFAISIILRLCHKLCGHNFVAILNPQLCFHVESGPREWVDPKMSKVVPILPLSSKRVNLFREQYFAHTYCAFRWMKKYILRVFGKILIFLTRVYSQIFKIHHWRYFCKRYFLSDFSMSCIAFFSNNEFFNVNWLI